MKHFIVVAFIMLFCFAVLPEFFVTDKAGENTGKGNIKQIEIINNGTQNNLNKNQSNNEKNQSNPPNETKANASADVKIGSSDEKSKVGEEKIKNEANKKNEPKINEYVVENEEGSTKQASSNAIQDKDEIKENESENNNLEENSVQEEDKKIRNANCQDCDDCDCESEKQECDCKEQEKKCESDKVNQFQIDEQGNSDWLKHRKEDKINNSNFIENKVADNEDENILPKVGLYEGGEDNKIIEPTNAVTENEKGKEEEVAQKNLPIEDKMINDHKQERAKKEVPGTSKIENMKMFDLNKEQPVYDVELLGIIDNATVIMQDGIVNVKVGA